jgi:hypothetical protein
MYRNSKNYVLPLSGLQVWLCLTGSAVPEVSNELKVFVFNQQEVQDEYTSLETP